MPNKKIYLSTFSLKVTDRTADTILNKFDGTNDFFNLFKDFADDIFQNVKRTNSFKDNVVLHITLDGPVNFDINERHFYGYVSSGIGGDSYTVRLAGETEAKFVADPDTDITFRKLFFYLQLPIKSTYGHLILQKHRNLGAKGSLEKALNLYLRDKGYNGFYARINNMLNGRVFDRMMSEGTLKNIDFIKKSIPSTLEDMYENGLKKDKGVLTTSIRANALSKYWKDFIKKYYKKDYKESLVEIEDGMADLDEIEFEMDLKGKKKTFHIVNKTKTLPDVEVSEELDFINSEPTVDSLVKVSKSLITDMLTLTPNVQAN